MERNVTVERHEVNDVTVEQQPEEANCEDEEANCEAEEVNVTVKQKPARKIF